LYRNPFRKPRDFLPGKMAKKRKRHAHRVSMARLRGGREENGKKKRKGNRKGSVCH